MKYGAGRWLSALVAVTLVVGCKPSEPSGNSSREGEVLTSGYTLSQSEFDRLSNEDQYLVATKVMSTMYRGLPLDSFLDLSNGLDSASVQYEDFIVDTQIKLQTRMRNADRVSAMDEIFGKEDDPATEVDDSIPARFTSLDSEHPHITTMAFIQGYPISKDMFSHWMSYFLANTIMFSPAREMDSTDSQDISRTLSFLQGNLIADKPVREIVRSWLHNLSRWRVSRSAENHALEMFELFLGQFNDTPQEQLDTLNGGIACSSWYLTDDDEEYQLRQDPLARENTPSVVVFGQYISSCEELYDLVAGHPALLPRVAEVIAYYLLNGASSEMRNQTIQNVVSSGAETFSDIFLGLMFSEAFLLHSERPKTFEENAFGFLGNMSYTPRAGSFPLDRAVLDRVLDSTNNGGFYAVHNMGWAAMDYKIGRLSFVPMDVLSFATYHKGIRESVLMNQRAYDGLNFPEESDYTESSDPRPAPFAIKDGAFYIAGTENLKPSLESLTPEEFVDFMFLSAMGRKASAEESSTLIAEGQNRDYLRVYDDELKFRRTTRNGDELHELWVDDWAEVMLDYMSRLPEFYYYRAANN